MPSEPLVPQKRNKLGQFLPHEENTRKSIQDVKTGVFVSPYDILRRRVENQSPENATRWFRKKIKELGIPDPMSVNQAFRAGGKNPIGKSGAGVIGKMFFYVYDAKLKDKLPYWDLLPFVLWFNFGTGKDGKQYAEGINLHYLPILWRMRLLGKLMEVSQSPMSPNEKLSVSWEFLGNIAQFPEVRSCVKRYLLKHIRSRIMVVDPEDWVMVAALPFEQFQKADKKTVWRDSVRKIRKLQRGG